jgi:hypothetical protein
MKAELFVLWLQALKGANQGSPTACYTQAKPVRWDLLSVRRSEARRLYIFSERGWHDKIVSAFLLSGRQVFCLLFCR